MSRRIISMTLVLAPALTTGWWAGLTRPAPATAPTRAEDRAARTVVLASGVPEEDLVQLTAAVAAAAPSGVLLLDTPRAGSANRAFLAAFRADQVIPVGSFPPGAVDAARRAGVTIAPRRAWQRAPSGEWWKTLFPRAERVVLCPAEPRGLLLQAACLAGTLQAPLFVIRGEPGEAAALCRRLETWGTQEVVAAGAAAKLGRDLAGLRLTALADEGAVAKARLQHICREGPIRTLVVANPADLKDGRGGMSSLAPWLAVPRRAPLLLTNAAGDNATEVIRHALRDPDLRGADILLLAAGLQAIPTEQRPNPIPGKDPVIEMEPMTPKGSEPFTLATGRLFHQDLGVAALQVARARLLPPAGSPRKALVVSNPGGGLPLLETFSRNTARELANNGYRTTALFEKEANKDEVRRLLPEQAIFLWEGHHKTLVEDYGLPGWTEPLPSSLIFLQSCLALNEEETRPLFDRGALAVVGSATRTYSASGGAFTLAFFDALLYEDETLGGALRQAKNFMLAYTLLKEKRLGPNSRLSGANVRSSWAFTLWGDPALKLPRPAAPAAPRPAVRHQVRRNTLVVSLPEEPYEKVAVGTYTARMLPNARLAGLLTRDMGEDVRRLASFLFVEVRLPEASPDRAPRLRGRIPERNWVFVWDGRRRCGYLLITPRPRDERELHFRIEWES